MDPGVGDRLALPPGVFHLFGLVVPLLADGQVVAAVGGPQAWVSRVFQAVGQAMRWVGAGGAGAPRTRYSCWPQTLSVRSANAC